MAIDSVTRRLPKLPTPERVWWTSRKLTKDSWLSPPEIDPSWRFQGYAKLANEAAAQLRNRYAWEAMPPNWTPPLSIPNVDVGGEWARNSTFTRDYKPEQFPGELYFEVANGMVFFDLTIAL